MEVYRLIIWSRFEEDQEDDLPFFLEFFSLSDALKAYENSVNEYFSSGRYVNIYLFSCNYDV